MTRTLITGGAGFIGSRLAKRLAAQGEVTVFDNLLPQAHEGNPENLARARACGARVVKGDVRDPGALRAVIAEAKPDVIYHFAAETGTGQSFDMPARYSDVNVMGTANLIEAIRAEVPELPRVILAGSRSVYGEGAYTGADGRAATACARDSARMEQGDFEVRDSAGAVLSPAATSAECPVAPASVYASTKLMQEHLLHQAFWGTPTGVGILRLQNVYGAGQSLNNPYTGVLSIFCRQIEEGRTLDIYEDGEIIRDFVHVDDVVRAFAQMGLTREMPKGIIDIGSGEPASILSVAKTLLELLGRPTDRYEITGKFRPGDIRYAVADIRRAAEELHWRPGKPLKDGLAELVDWSRTELQTAKFAS